MTTTDADQAKPSPHPGLSFPAFVVMIAALMAMNAFAIDAMLPALPTIGADLGIPTENGRQWIITAYLLGFGGAQLIYGPLADRYGRKPVLIVGVGIYVLFSVVCALAPTFETMLIARAIQGVGAASTRVLAISIVRDCYAGRTMARVMSLTFIVFLGIPIIAPSVGQLIIMVGPWRWIFGVLALFSGSVLAWAIWKLPETLHPEYRIPIKIGRIADSFRQSLSNRVAVGYMLASTCVAGALFGFINSSQQIFADVFGAGDWFALIFACIAGSIAVASLLNSRLVERLGTRLLSHTALMGFIALSAIHAAVALMGFESLWTFAILQMLTMFCFGLMGGNFGAMAMEPLGHVAGAASSVQGFVSGIGGALAGFVIGQSFNGTSAPLAIGFTVAGLMALGFVLFAEKGRLFQATHLPPAGAAAD